jgi:N-ethylmaleimide reductase
MHYRYGDGSLFDPVKLGALQLSNRIVMASLTRNRSSENGVPPDFAALYYAQRAEAGLLISAATNISPQARGYAMTPGIWLPEQVAAWAKVTHAVHERGGSMFLQLWHTGRLTPRCTLGDQTGWPSLYRDGVERFRCASRPQGGRNRRHRG